jgi:hypothetical protein
MMTVTVLTLSVAAGLARTAEAGLFGHRGQTYVYNGSTGYYTGGPTPVNYGYSYGYQPSYAPTYAQPRGYVTPYAVPMTYYPVQPVYVVPRVTVMPVLRGPGPDETTEPMDRHLIRIKARAGASSEVGPTSVGPEPFIVWPD